MLNTMIVTENAKAYFSTTLKWAHFLYVIGIIGIVFMFLAGAAFVVIGCVSDDVASNIGKSSVEVVIMGIAYMVLALVMIIPLVYMNRMLGKGTEAVNNDDDAAFETSLMNMKSLAKFYGIYTIVALAMIPVIMIIAVIASVASVS